MKIKILPFVGKSVLVKNNYDILEIEMDENPIKKVIDYVSSFYIYYDKVYNPILLYRLIDNSDCFTIVYSVIGLSEKKLNREFVDKEKLVLVDYSILCSYHFENKTGIL